MSRNAFIARLGEDDRKALLGICQTVTLALDAVVTRQEAPVTQVCLPLDSQLANIVRLPEGAAIETSVIGAEGISGLAPFMADAPCPWEIRVRQSGSALQTTASELRSLGDQRPSLRADLMTLVHFYQAQASQLAACNAIHAVTQRIARWLLTMDDLSPGRRVDCTQEELGGLLGIQRTSVSEAMNRLRDLKGVRFSRGVIHLEDRQPLERAACDCYAILRDQAARLRLLP